MSGKDDPLAQIKRRLPNRYSDVRQIGSGSFAHLRIAYGRRTAVASPDEDGWFVDLWIEKNRQLREEELIEEGVVPTQEEAIKRILDWLDSGLRPE
jgi:hypothetical protein